MKILMQHLEFSFGSLNGDYSEQTLENFEYMFNRLEEDNLGMFISIMFLNFISME